MTLSATDGYPAAQIQACHRSFFDLCRTHDLPDLTVCHVTRGLFRGLDAQYRRQFYFHFGDQSPGIFFADSYHVGGGGQPCHVTNIGQTQILSQKRTDGTIQVIMCLDTSQDQIGFQFLEQIGKGARKGMIIAAAEVPGQPDQLIGALCCRRKEEIVRSFGLSHCDDHLAANPLFEEDGLFNCVIIEFVNDQTQPGCIQGGSTWINGKFLHQVRNKFDRNCDLHGSPPSLPWIRQLIRQSP